MDNVCRTCLTDEGERLSIINTYNESGNSFSYTEMLQEVASVQVSLDDGFSSLICKQCVENLGKAFAFRLQCQKSDAIIRQSKIINIKTEEIDRCNDFCSNDFYSHQIKDEPKFEVSDIKTEISNGLTEIKGETINYEEKTEPKSKTEKKNKTAVNIKIKRINRKNNRESIGLNKIKTKRKIRKTLPTTKISNDAIVKETLTDDYFNELTETELKNKELKKAEKRSDHHFYELTENGEVQYPCFVCKEVFKTYVNLMKHTKTHNVNKPYICRQCGNCYTNSNGLRTHYVKHTIGLAFCCEICGRRFLHSSHLKIHIRRHKGDRPFSCPHCNKTFSTKPVLNTHLKMHGTIKLQSCKICGKKVRQINSHMNIHRTEKKYSCHICGNKFTFKGELNAHMVIHTGDKKYVCTVCSKPFGWSSSLRKHMLIHANKRAFVCELCGKDFMHKHVMQAHMKKH